MSGYLGTMLVARHCLPVSACLADVTKSHQSIEAGLAHSSQSRANREDWRLSLLGKLRVAEIRWDLPWEQDG